MLRDLVIKDLYALKVDKQLEIQAEKFINLLYDNVQPSYHPSISINDFMLNLSFSYKHNYCSIHINRGGQYLYFLDTLGEELMSDWIPIEKLDDKLKNHNFGNPTQKDVDAENLQFNSLTNDTDAYCTHCKEVSTYDHESLPWNDDEKQELTCNMCGEEFITMVSVTYTRSSRFKDG